MKKKPAQAKQSSLLFSLALGRGMTRMMMMLMMGKKDNFAFSIKRDEKRVWTKKAASLLRSWRMKKQGKKTVYSPAAAAA